MKNILKRLFIIAPLVLCAIAVNLTIVIPFFYWVLTGKALWDEQFNWFEKQHENMNK